PPLRSPGTRRACPRGRTRPPGSRPLLSQLLDLLPRVRVDDVLLRQPRPPGLAHAELDVVERRELVAVGVDHELEPGLARRARVHVGQIETVGLRIDLEERARLERLLDHALDVDRGGLALPDLA